MKKWEAVPHRVEGTVITYEQVRAVETYFLLFPDEKVLPVQFVPADLFNKAIDWFNHRGE